MIVNVLVDDIPANLKEGQEIMLRVPIDCWGKPKFMDVKAIYKGGSSFGVLSHLNDYMTRSIFNAHILRIVKK